MKGMRGCGEGFGCSEEMSWPIPCHLSSLTHLRAIHLLQHRALRRLIVSILLHLAGVDHIYHVGDGHRGLCDVGGHYDFTHTRSEDMKHSSLGDKRKMGNNERKSGLEGVCVVGKNMGYPARVMRGKVD